MRLCIVFATKKIEIDTLNFLNVTNHISSVVTVSTNSQKPWNQEGSNVLEYLSYLLKLFRKEGLEL